MPHPIPEGMTSTMLLDQLIDYLKTQTGKAFVTIDEYAGEFNSTEIGRLGFNSPAVLVTLLGWKPPVASSRLGGPRAARARVAAFIVTKDGKGRVSRMRAAAERAELICGLLPAWRPTGCINAVSGIEAQNLYSAAVDKGGLSLWSVTWWQDIQWRYDPPALSDLTDLQEIDIASIAHTSVPAPLPSVDPLPISHDVTLAPTE